MRRFAAVFSSKRSERNEQHPDNTRNLKKVHTSNTLSSLPILPSSPSTPVLSVVTNPSASSTSSAYSSSIRTPDDDQLTPSTLTRSSTRKSWISKLVRRKSSTLKPVRSPERADIPASWSPRSPPKLQPAPGKGRPVVPKVQQVDSEDETSEEEEEDDEDDDSRNEPPKAAPLKVTPASIAHSRQFLTLLTANALKPHPSSSPFYNHPGTPPFPRSSNRSFLRPAVSTLRVDMLRSRLLHHLRTTVPSQAHEILHFATRALPAALDHLPVDPIDEQALALKNQAQHVSPGLRRWISRPAFEERYAVWYPKEDIPGQLQCRAVPGTRFAVLDLEYSLALEVMAGADEVLDSSIPSVALESMSLPDFAGFDLPTLSLIESGPDLSEKNVAKPSQATPSENGELELAYLTLPSEPETSTKAASSETLTQTTTKDDSSTLTMPGRAAYKASPSPLRMQHAPLSLQGSSTTSQHPDVSDPPAARRGVRFAEDDKEDQIPIGYVLRLKKKKAEKARFLAEEEARRAQSQLQVAHQKEAAKLEAERRQREAERNEWEKERRAWEREKKAMEEERNQRKYAEEVAAARVRRETTRAGNVPGTGFGVSSTGAWVPPPSSYSSDSVRSKRSSSRPNLGMVQSNPCLPQLPGMYPGFQTEPRPQIPELAPSSNNSTGSPYDGSPSSSRPPSGETAMSTPPFGSPDRSRPASLYSSQQASAEDLRPGHYKRSSRAASERGSPSMTAMQMPYGWGFTPGYFIPPVPALPPYAMDVPLLPPSAPFMMQQYPRPRSQMSQGQPGSPGSSGHSSSSKSRIPSSGSEESLNQNRRSQIRQSSAPAVGGSASSRRGSMDMGRSSARGSTTDLHERGRSSHSTSGHSSRQSSQPRSRPTSYSSSSLRGVPTQMYMGPMYLQEPSPWSAPPTAAQLGAGYGSTGSLGAVSNGSPRPSSRQAYGRRQTAIS